MSFISTQLRDNCLQYPMAEEAADEIDRLENEHSKLLDAIEAAQAENERLKKENMQLLRNSVASIEAAQARIKELEARQAIPNGWIALRIDFDAGYPEDVAFGPEIMMRRLEKWLNRYFELISAQPPEQESE